MPSDFPSPGAIADMPAPWEWFEPLLRGMDMPERWDIPRPPEQPDDTVPAPPLGFGEITPGITPGQWSTIRGPHQGSGIEQAIAEYQARTAHPRSGIPDDQPENLARELFTPFLLGLGAGANAFGFPTSQRQQVHKAGDDWYGLNPTTRQWEKVITGPEKDKAAEIQLKDLTERIQKTYAELLKEQARDVSEFGEEGKRQKADNVNRLRAYVEEYVDRRNKLLGKTAAAQETAPPPDVLNPASAAEAEALYEPLSPPGRRKAFSFIQSSASPTAAMDNRPGRMNPLPDFGSFPLPANPITNRTVRVLGIRKR